MKKILIFTLLLSNISFAQNTHIKKIFESKDEKVKYLKIPNNEIQLFENKIILDSIEIEFLEQLSNEFLQILAEGLLIPNEIRGKICCLRELNEINPNPQVKRFSFWSFPKRIENPVDSTSVDYILSTRLNPDVYYFELENKNADEKTDILEFIKGSSLIFFKYGGIIL